jgi:discoidin domain receptor family protein 2
VISVISGGIIAYQIPEDSAREGAQDFSDSSYDGIRREGELVGGLGQLVDGEVGGDNFKLDIGYGKGESNTCKELCLLGCYAAWLV